MALHDPIRDALRFFASEVKSKLSQIALGEPEDQLRAPFESLMKQAAQAIANKTAVCTGEPSLSGGIGKPDFAIHLDQVLIGYAELKAPGVGASHDHFTGHNREQFGRFAAIPNILYTDGNEWALYHNGERVGSVLRLSGDITTAGPAAIETSDAKVLTTLLRTFFSWDPVLPIDAGGQLDLKAFAESIAPLCRMLRDDVAGAVGPVDSPLSKLRDDWRDLLFPNASDTQFADAYAQTTTFALLLGRSEGADPLTTQTAKEALSAQHALLSRALEVLTDVRVLNNIDTSLSLLLRVIGAVPPSTFRASHDPWLYFYEDFLAVYDPVLRKDAGVYFTPMQVVRAQVRLIDELLVTKLRKAQGFASSGVITLDPAVGTGTYLLGIIEHTVTRATQTQGAGAVPGQASELAKNLYGFEQMVGSYAVAELRVTRALGALGALLPADGIHVYLTDTLEQPSVKPSQLGLFYEPIAEQQAKAAEVKSTMPVIVCLGNPPYDRHAAASDANRASTGGWVRWGDTGDRKTAILEDFRAPVIAAGHGVHVKNLYNLYVYFWRWALWKVFEQEQSTRPGVVSFISASSFLDGPAFAGMRRHLREACEDVWIIDCGGEGRGTHQDDNVFAIRTPVAISIGFRTSHVDRDVPARVRYVRLHGSKDAKLAALDAIEGFSNIDWRDCPSNWDAPLLPKGTGTYFRWPLLVDLMPWQHSGTQFKRTWPICSDRDTLEQRWRSLLVREDRAIALRETESRTVVSKCKSLFGSEALTPIWSLPDDTPTPPVTRYSYRTLDRQWIIADARLCDRPRPDLWRAHGSRQVYLTSLLRSRLGAGPALSASAEIPDLHHFRGSYGGKHVIPLYRDSGAVEANIAPGMLELLSQSYEDSVTPEDFLAYIYGTLAHPDFTARFFQDEDTRELRVPVTKDPILFKRLRGLGQRLLWLHTFGERYVPSDRLSGQIPSGLARCLKAVPAESAGYPTCFSYVEALQTLHVGSGQFAPVAPQVYEFSVSGFPVVERWLGYRMRAGAGKKSSPLDDIRPLSWTSEATTELLELLWVIEGTIDCYEEQAELLDQVTASDCFLASDFPASPSGLVTRAAGDRAPQQAEFAENKSAQV